MDERSMAGSTLTSGTSIIWLVADTHVSTTGSPEWNLESGHDESGTLLGPEGSTLDHL